MGPLPTVVYIGMVPGPSTTPLGLPRVPRPRARHLVLRGWLRGEALGDVNLKNKISCLKKKKITCFTCVYLRIVEELKIGTSKL